MIQLQRGVGEASSRSPCGDCGKWVWGLSGLGYLWGWRSYTLDLCESMIASELDV